MTPAVQMLIDRMQTHPEEFFGEVGYRNPLTGTSNYEGAPKFREFARQIERHIIPETSPDSPDITPLWHLTDVERQALREAYTEARRVRFSAEVIHALLTPDPDPQDRIYPVESLRLDASGALGVGTTAVRYFSTVSHAKDSS